MGEYTIDDSNNPANFPPGYKSHGERMQEREGRSLELLEEIKTALASILAILEDWAEDRRIEEWNKNN